MLWEEKLWEPKWDSFRPCHHRQVGGELIETIIPGFFPLWISTLSTDRLGFAIRLVLGYLQDKASPACVFLFWLAFLGRSQNHPLWTCVSKFMMGFFSRCTDVKLIRSMWMVKDASSPIWQSWVSVSFLEEAVYPKLRGNCFIILSDCCWVWRLSI